MTHLAIAFPTGLVTAGVEALVLGAVTRPTDGVSVPGGGAGLLLLLLTVLPGLTLPTLTHIPIMHRGVNTLVIVSMKHADNISVLPFNNSSEALTTELNVPKSNFLDS